MAERVRLALHWRILIGLALGVIAGLIVNAAWTDQTWASVGVNDAKAFLSGKSPEGVNDNAGIVAHAAGFVRNLMEFVGDLFMRGLRFIAVPIVLFSLAAGVASLNDTAKLGRVGGKTIGIYLATTAVAISVGLLLANTIGPGNGFPDELRDTIAAQQADNAADKIESAEEEKEKGTWKILLNIFPENPFESMANGNTLQVVVVGLLVGVALTLLPRERAKPLVGFFEGMTEVVIKIVHMVLLIAPFAVFALIVVVIADLGIEVLKSLARYAVVVVLGLSIMVFGVYPGVLRMLTPVGYRRFFRSISPAQLLAFSSSSSGATLPVTMECCEER
ncbi:MAG: dicarboxylate/amino acid:cation symporter, partial [Planctomycetota bacterium]